MNVYWLFLILGGFIALFSKEIDAAAARRSRNANKRAGVVAGILIAVSLLGLILSHLL